MEERRFVPFLEGFHLLGREDEVFCHIRILVLGSDLHTDEEEPGEEGGGLHQHPWAQISEL